MFNVVLGRRKKVSPKIKRMTMMLYLYSRIFFGRKKQEFFEKLKLVTGTTEIKMKVAGKLLENAINRKREVVKFWMKSIRIEKEI